VRGELTLVDIILEAGRHGALIIQGLPLGARPGGFPAPRASLIRSAIQGCEKKTGGGGAAAFITGLGVALVLDQSALEDNVAESGDGGAILATMGAVVQVRNGTRFANNTAVVGSGGAVACLACSTIELRGATRFEHNTAGRDGGALALVDAVSHTISSAGSLFRGNVAEHGDGGAVSLFDAEAQGNWTSIGDVFDKNSATLGSGGAIAAMGTRVSLTSATRCSGNHAPRGIGGCLVWEPFADTHDSPAWDRLAPDIAVENNSFVDNHAGWAFWPQTDNKAAHRPNDFATPPVALITIVGLFISDDEVTLTTSAIRSPAAGTSPLFPTPLVRLVDWYGQHVVGKFAQGAEVHISMIGVAEGAKCELGGHLVEVVDGKFLLCTVFSLYSVLCFMFYVLCISILTRPPTLTQYITTTTDADATLFVFLFNEQGKRNGSRPCLIKCFRKERRALGPTT
jgi:predicted outer membrane repeat protein